MGLVMTIGLLGIPATAWVSRFVVPIAPWGWRLIFVWGGIGILALLYAARIPESPRWLNSHHRTAEAIAELGYADASMAEIARRAGIAKSVVSYHFSDKTELMS